MVRFLGVGGVNLMRFVYGWIHQQKTEFWGAWFELTQEVQENHVLYSLLIIGFLRPTYFLSRAFQWPQQKCLAVSDSEWNLHSFSITDVDILWLANLMWPPFEPLESLAEKILVNPPSPLFSFKYINIWSVESLYLSTCVIQFACVCYFRTSKHYLMGLWLSVSFAILAILRMYSLPARLKPNVTNT
jgi:hypothetical protein